MKKAMIITIGTGSGVDKGIVFSVKQQNPDLLCFIYSEQSKKTLEMVLDKLSKKPEDPNVMLKSLDEINDVEKLHREYSKYIDEVIQKGYQPSEIVVDYTSGTKSMSAALVSAAITKEIASLSYVHGERDKEGRVQHGTERLITLSPNAIFTEQKIKLFKELFNHYQFDSACELLQNTSLHVSYKEQVDFYLNLAKGFAEWDRFRFKEASEHLNKIDMKLAAKFGLKSYLEKAKVVLHKLKEANENQKLTEYDLKDLFSNAIRRYEENKYDDCVARLYRLVEMTAQIEFEKELHTTTDKVRIEILPEKLKTKYQHLVKNDEFIELPLLDAFTVLAEKTQSEKAKIFYEKLDEFKKLLSARNYSRLAHGQKPISKETCENLIEFVKNVLKLKDEDEIKFRKLEIK